MEALDDGTPMYYNSNILGRYMRKDYGQFHENLRTTYDWSIDRMNELCTDGDIEQLKDAVSIRQEFAEWLLREDKSVNHDIVSLEYMGKGSEYDI